MKSALLAEKAEQACQDAQLVVSCEGETEEILEDSKVCKVMSGEEIPSDTPTGDQMTLNPAAASYRPRDASQQPLMINMTPALETEYPDDQYMK